MNQTAIGGYIARKRKEQNLTQEQLAQQLGVSNKTISKWENGKCMPDYSIIQKLCDVIHVSLPELMDGEDAAEDSVRVYDDEQILDLLRRTQELERQKGVLCGFVLIVLGIASSALSRTTGGTDVQDFLSGILMGLSVAEILAGIWTSAPEAVKTHRLLRANRSVQRRRCVCFVYCFGTSSSPSSHAGSLRVMARISPLLTP